METAKGTCRSTDTSGNRPLPIEMSGDNAEKNTIPEDCIELNNDFGPNYLQYNPEVFTVLDCAPACRGNSGMQSFILSNSDENMHILDDS